MGIASILGDLGGPHPPDYLPSPTLAGSPNVFSCGSLQQRMTDPILLHVSPSIGAPHPRTILGCSSTVFVNSLGAARLGDAVNCGGVLIGSGCPTVIIGG